MMLRGWRKLFSANVLAIALMLGALVHGANAPQVSASGAWIRWLPNGIPAAGYVTLRNSSNQVVTLVTASTPDYGAAMFHESRNQNGVQRMLPISSVRIESHSEVTFGPRGLHIMLMQPARSLKPGDHVLLTLRFADGSSLPVEFEVRKPDGTS
jgi:hypothetical protein